MDEFGEIFMYCEEMFDCLMDLDAVFDKIGSLEWKNCGCDWIEICSLWVDSIWGVDFGDLLMNADSDNLFVLADDGNFVWNCGFTLLVKVDMG